MIRICLFLGVVDCDTCQPVPEICLKEKPQYICTRCIFLNIENQSSIGYQTTQN